LIDSNTDEKARNQNALAAGLFVFGSELRPAS